MPNILAQSTVTGPKICFENVSPDYSQTRSMGAKWQVCLEYWSLNKKYACNELKGLSHLSKYKFVSEKKIKKDIRIVTFSSFCNAFISEFITGVSDSIKTSWRLLLNGFSNKRICAIKFWTDANTYNNLGALIHGIPNSCFQIIHIDIKGTDIKGTTRVDAANLITINQ